MNDTNVRCTEAKQEKSELGVFAKFWQPGAVKTRLAASVGNERAAEIYHEFLTTTLARFGHLADRRVIGFTPAERQAEFAQLAGSDWSLRPQADGDLGGRMHTYFEQSFADGVERVVLIGSDSPTLPVEFIEQAFELLAQKQVVLGPTEDGGYYLVGISGSIRPIFEEIPWSTPDVWKTTVAQLNQHSIDYAELPLWYDIDDEEDLKRLYY